MRIQNIKDMINNTPLWKIDTGVLRASQLIKQS